ncbi:peptide/nickel transport system ATP-binding protein [Kaistia hirudinis]|uniref:Peptide/nickel transport system ATP-binding protein n=1 Tax=Kaistia hirudinis TaxID=1293440 RepID=A0A840AJX3_9HYPH|nr:ABC transporter ATP-binding protein [Kaistia hirudinis]MBB3929327.1 peptide/nickel transport system ATP-binding protein [Kaistia hirudinis]
MSLLSIRDLVVSYRGHSGGTVTAVAGCNLDVEAGQIVALVGESGCGKSSLGKTAVGLIHPAGGSVTFDGERVVPLGRKARPAPQRRLQMVFQDPFSSLNPRRKIGDLIADGIRVSEGHGGRRFSVGECLERVGLSAGIADRFPHQFSGGQRQRIAIARALAADPRCIVADEPISALDASAQASIANLLVELVEELDVGLLFISHDLSIVRRIADVTAVMYLGKIVEMAPSEALWQRPLHPYSAGLIGAITEPDGEGRLPADLPGDVPDPAAPPSGCRFHPRCPIALERCSVEEPAWRLLAPGRTVACHRAEAALT